MGYPNTKFFRGPLAMKNVNFPRHPHVELGKVGLERLQDLHGTILQKFRTMDFGQNFNSWNQSKPYIIYRSLSELTQKTELCGVERGASFISANRKLIGFFLTQPWVLVESFLDVEIPEVNYLPAKLLKKRVRNVAFFSAHNWICVGIRVDPPNSGGCEGL